MGATSADSVGELLSQLADALSVRFEFPERAWVAVPLLLVLLLAPLAARGKRPRPVATLITRGLLLATLTCVLMEPTFGYQREQTGELLVVADVSPSVGDHGIEEAKALLKRAAAPGFSLVAFGAEPQSATELAPDPRPSTDLGAALRFAAAHASPDKPTRIVVISDGRSTVRGAERAAMRLRSGRIELWALPIPKDVPLDAPAIAVDAVLVPPKRERTGPFTLRAKVEAERASNVTATLYLDGRREASREVALRPGENDIDFAALSLGPGLYHAQVLLEDDRTPLDNVRKKTFLVPGTPKVLFLAVRKRRSLIAEALAKQGMKVTVAAADKGSLEGYDAVVILPDAPVRALERRTADLAAHLARGGGLLSIGGSEGPGLARLHGSPTAQFLPVDVEPRPRQDKEKPAPPKPNRTPKVEIIEEDTQAYPITLCLVIDRSGSMRGRKMRQAVAAAAAAANALTDKDRVAIVSFGDNAEIEMEAQAAGDPGAVREALADLEASGRTAMYGALRAASALMVRETSPIRHVVLISDGVPTDQGRWRDLIASMVKEKITLSAVGIGFDIDSHLLGRLATWGHGMYWIANHPHRVPQVVTQDTMRIVEARNRRGKDAERSRRNEKKPEKPQEKTPEQKRPETRPLAPETVPIVPDAGAPREMFLGLKDKQLPEVAGVEKSKLRFASWSAAQAGKQGPPLLAYARVGLGTSAALLVDPEAPGSKKLREHDEFARLMAQLVRSVLPDVRGEPFQVDYELSENSLAVNLLGEDGLSRTDLALTATLDGEPLTVRRRGGRFEVALPPRTKPGRVDLRVGGAAKPLLQRSLVVPASRNDELAGVGADRARLLRLTGSPQRLDAAPGAALARPIRQLPARRPLPLPFLLLAAILLPLDAWARRRASR